MTMASKAKREAPLVNKAQHTPGPWVYRGGTTTIREADGSMICQMKFLTGPYGLSGRRPNNEVHANARLIAAAPDLLEALKAARNELMMLGEPGTSAERVVDQIDAAIAKAEPSEPGSPAMSPDDQGGNCPQSESAKVGE